MPTPTATNDSNTEMRAATFRRYGPPSVVQVEKVLKPIPKADQVLVKVHAASLNRGDWHLMKGEPAVIRLGFGLTKPKYPVPGADVAGVVQQVGPDVRRLKAGDEVFGDISDVGFGAFAEFVCVKEDTLTTKPTKLSFEEAAALPAAGMTALQAVRDHGAVRSGHKVLVNGAAGGIGHYAVQLAKHYGAHVTAVCSTKSVPMVKALGADAVIDYKVTDFVTTGAHYDVIIDTAAHRPIKELQPALAPTGTYVPIGGNFVMTSMLQASWVLGKGQSSKPFVVSINRADLEHLAELADRAVLKPTIDQRFKLEQSQAAFQMLDTGGARGKSVINIV